ncbi:MAG: hypothetical protein ACP5PP_01560 [Fervidobacterium sp.]
MRLGIVSVGNIRSMIHEVLNKNVEREFFIFNRSNDKIRKYEGLENVKVCSSVREGL